MTWLEFVSATIGHLVWPLVVIAAVWLLRGSIGTLVASDRLESLKVGASGLELQLRARLDQAEQALEESSSSDEGVAGQVDARLGVDALGAFRTEMRAIAAVSPRAAVTESHSRLEGLLRESLVAHGAGDEVTGKRRTMVFLLQHAKSYGLISAELANTATMLMRVRNDVTHEPNEQITQATALRYIDLVADVMSAISV